MAVFQGCPAIEVEGQVAHDAIKVADRLRQRDQVVRALAETKPGFLNHVFCLGPTAHDRCGVIDQGKAMREVKLEPVVVVGHENPGGRASDLKVAGY